MDAYGSAGTLRDALGALRRRGRHVQVGLLAGELGDPSVPMSRVVAEELEIYGSHGLAATAYPGMLAEIAAAAMPLGELVGRVVPLAAAPGELAAITGGSPSGVTVILP